MNLQEDKCLTSQLCCPSHDKEDRCDYKVFGKPWEEANVVRHDTVSITISTKNCTSEVCVSQRRFSSVRDSIHQDHPSNLSVALELSLPETRKRSLFLLSDRCAAVRMERESV